MRNTNVNDFSIKIITNPINFQITPLIKIPPGCRLLGFPKMQRVPEARMDFFWKGECEKASQRHISPSWPLYFVSRWRRRCDDDFLEARRPSSQGRCYLQGPCYRLSPDIFCCMDTSLLAHTAHRRWERERWISGPSFGHSDALITTRILTFILSSSLTRSLRI